MKKTHTPRQLSAQRRRLDLAVAHCLDLRARRHLTHPAPRARCLGLRAPLRRPGILMYESIFRCDVSVTDRTYHQPPDTSIWPTLFDFGSTEYNDVQQPQVFIPNDLQEDLDRMNSLNYDYYVGNLMGRGYNYQ